MQSVVVDVAEDGAGTDTVGAIFGVDELAETVHDHGAVHPLALSLVLLGLKQRDVSASRSSTHLQRQLLISWRRTGKPIQNKKKKDLSTSVRKQTLFPFSQTEDGKRPPLSLSGFSHLGLQLEAQAAPVSLIVKLVVGVHDSAKVDAANLLRAALGLHVVEQSVDDATNASLVFQIVNVFWRKSGGESNELLETDLKTSRDAEKHFRHSYNIIL